MITRAQRRRLDANGGFLIVGEEEIPAKRRKRTKPLVSELKMELAMIGLSMEGRKRDLQDQLDCYSNQPNFFNLLPEELCLKIVKMVAAKRENEYWAWAEDYGHDLIIDILSNISTRFNRIFQVVVDGDCNNHNGQHTQNGPHDQLIPWRQSRQTTIWWKRRVQKTSQNQARDLCRKLIHHCLQVH